MKKWVYIVFNLIVVSLLAQTEYPMNLENNNDEIYVCDGIFTDDGGSGSNYSPFMNNRIITFCPGGPDSQNLILRMDFTSFYTQNNVDRLLVYYGSSATGTPDEVYTGDLPNFVIFSEQAGGCLTFKFESNIIEQYQGWVAEISCFYPCIPPTAAFSNTSDIHICPSTPSNLTQTFDASASYSSDSFPISEYIWYWGDGTTSVTANPITQHTFPNSYGIYNVGLRVKTDNFQANPYGCYSANSSQQTVNVIPPPSFDGSIATQQTISCGSSLELEGVVSSQTVVQNDPYPNQTQLILPDEVQVPFESTLDMTGQFPPGTTITSNCIPEILINFEHSFAGDLHIILIAPSGEEVMLFKGYRNGFYGTHFGYCVNELNGNEPGCPAPYYIVNGNGINWDDPTAENGVTQNCSLYNGACEISGGYFSQNGRFNSYQSLNNLIGAELNGIWTLRIIDYIIGDNGYFDTWSMNFPENCYGPNGTLTPQITNATWNHTGSGPSIGTEQISNTPYETTGIDDCPTNQNCIGNQMSNITTVGPFNAAGTFSYTFNATDEFGCIHSYEVDVEVQQGTADFDSMTTEYCKLDSPDELPNVSSNGISGSWNPSEIDTSNVGESTYTFTPNNSGCATSVDLIIIVHDLPNLSEIVY